MRKRSGWVAALFGSWRGVSWLGVGLLVAGGASGQPSVEYPSVWTLGECLDYAVTHSLAAQRESLEEISANAQLRAAKWAFAPSLSASATHGYDFGRAIDYGSNTVSNDLQSTSFRVGASVTLFDGFADLRTLQLRGLELEGQRARRAVVTAELMLGVARAYLQVIYQEELLGVRIEELAVSEQQLELGRKRAEAGAIAEGALLELEARVAASSSALVAAENARGQARLELVQRMNLRGFTAIDVVRPGLDSASLPGPPALGPDAIYERSLGVYPTIREAVVGERAAARRLDLARSGHYPRLSLGASVGSAARFFLDTRGHAAAEPFGEQMRSNLSTGVALTLTVPIFDRFATWSGVSRARVGVARARLAREQAEDALYRAIQTAYHDAVSGYRQLVSARRNVARHVEASRWAMTKLSAGAISSYDMEQTQLRLTEARVALLQASVDYLFKMRILAFYQGEPLAF